MEEIKGDEIQEAVTPTTIPELQDVCETQVELIMDPSKVNPKKVPDGTLHIVQSRPGLFVVVEFHEGVAKMKYPKLMSLCQLCARNDCKHFKKLKQFTNCTRRLGMCPSELTVRFKELMEDMIPKTLPRQPAEVKVDA